MEGLTAFSVDLSSLAKRIMTDITETVGPKLQYSPVRHCGNLFGPDAKGCFVVDLRFSPTKFR